MGQIHLFASTLTPVMRDFLVEYEDGKLHPVAMVRVLDEHPYPHSQIICAALEYNYIVVEVSDPLQWRDLEWLHSAIVRKRFEFDRWNAKRYSIDRALNLPAGQKGRRYVANEEQWAKINHFRRLLELPALALRLLEETHTEGDHVRTRRYDVDASAESPAGRVLLIEYEGTTVEQPPRRPGEGRHVR